MAFVRKKRLGGYEYYQLVENRWIDGKSRQRVLLHLGRYSDIEVALKEWPGAIERLGRFAQREREKAERLSKTRALVQEVGLRGIGQQKQSGGLAPWQRT